MATETSTSGYVTVSDGVRLRYWQDGPVSGPNIVFIPGWVQTAAQFRKQVEHFQTAFRVTTYDHRGHGESDKPSFGYRVSRLAADLDALLAHLDLRDAVLVGHSMGAAVLWSHWDLFPRDRIAKLVFVDQAPCMTIDPTWAPSQAAESSALFTAAQRFDIAAALRGPGWEEAWRALSRSFFTPEADPADVEWALAQQTKASREGAAALIADHVALDHRDVMSRIDVPTLTVAGRGSLFPTAGAEWIGKQTGGRVEIFEKGEGGSHFMFWENPEKFNRILEEFLST
ncbi:alpha/beta-hydrolase [Daldinia caldariorum]|uniref:alpha/beta-hydrolase n=1 Tax=Daldinia caldariorum TaxID=326644 RepID=UPI002007AF8A|nr:alpha/beta-hydrolase [Daldinia caldariorum]KAI1472508.1 alpha/beta-hydrolase [Daldinia caldariorum]